MFGTYKQLKFLGNGRYCNVYEVLDMRNDKRVALKVFVNELNKQSRDMFSSEIRVLNSISHPNIVRLLGVNYHPEKFITLELCENGDLYDYVIKKRVETKAKSGSLSTSCWKVLKFYTKPVCVIGTSNSKIYL